MRRVVAEVVSRPEEPRDGVFDVDLTGFSVDLLGTVQKFLPEIPTVQDF
jgi:hypothetical protein